MLEGRDLLIEIGHAAAGDGETLSPLVTILFFGLALLGDANRFGVELLTEEGSLRAGWAGTTPLPPVSAGGAGNREVREGDRCRHRRSLERAIAEVDGEGICAGTEMAGEGFEAIVRDGGWNQRCSVAGPMNEFTTDDGTAPLIPISLFFVAEGLGADLEVDGEWIVALDGDRRDWGWGKWDLRQRLQGSEISEIMLDGGEGVIKQGDPFRPRVGRLVGGLGALQVVGELLTTGEQLGERSGGLW